MKVLNFISSSMLIDSSFASSDILYLLRLTSIFSNLSLFYRSYIIFLIVSGLTPTFLLLLSFVKLFKLKSVIVPPPKVL